MTYDLPNKVEPDKNVTTTTMNNPCDDRKFIIIVNSSGKQIQNIQKDMRNEDSYKLSHKVQPDKNLPTNMSYNPCDNRISIIIENTSNKRTSKYSET